MNKIKVLTITTSGLSRKEGISTVILDYYSLFDKDKFLLDIIASGEYAYQLVTEFQAIGVNVRCLPSRKISLMKYIKGLIGLMKQEKYDAIYIHGSSSLMTIELIIAKVCGIKKRIVHSHNTTCDHLKVDKILRPLFYHSYTKALACGQDAGKWLYGNREFEIIKNGRDVEKYRFNPAKREEIRKQFKLGSSVLAIGHVGNFNEQKNQKFLIDVLDRMVSYKDDIRLYLMGDGRKRDEVIQYVKEKELQDYVVFTGSIHNVPDMLQAMDVMLLPSLHEGLPLVAIEWQIAGLPCVLSDCVTRECAYTELVHFLPLEDCQKWADEILNIVRADRSEMADKWVQMTKDNGYSLHDNVAYLQECL